MKTLTTLTAAIALIAGMSIANAAENSTMGKDQNSMSQSAKVIGTDKYCAKTKTGELDCKYASLEACQSGANGAECEANPHTSTTGSK